MTCDVASIFEVKSWGNSTVTSTAGTDAFAWSCGNLTATLSAGEDAIAVTFGNGTATVTAQFGEALEAAWDNYVEYSVQGGADTPADGWDRATSIGTQVGRGMAVAGAVGAAMVTALPAIFGCEAAGAIMTVVGTVGTGASIVQTVQAIANWDHLSPLEQDRVIGGIVTDVMFSAIGFAARRLGCFTEETPVAMPADSGGAWYAGAGFAVAVTVVGASLARSGPRRKDDEESRITRGAALAEWPDDETFEPEFNMSDNESIDDLCDRLFQDNGEMWWPCEAERKISSDP